MKINAMAAKLVEPYMLVNIPKLITAYFNGIPDPNVPEQRVLFGTSGHRGSSFKNAFNQNHIIAITQAICEYRKLQKITGPLYMGIDTHALSIPACNTALEVLAANNVNVILAEDDEYTPTPVISHAILAYNKGRKDGWADGIIITPSHNPPEDGGFKYNPPHGGPAEGNITNTIEQRANDLLKTNLAGVKRMQFSKAIIASTTHRYNYLNAYVSDLKNVIDMDSIRHSKIRMGVDPLGGAGVHYWPAIAEYYKLNLTTVNTVVDPTFSFMTLDWDGQIRMDPSSAYAMQSLIDLKDKFDISFACDTDHDRHGIVTKSVGLLNPNQYLSVAINYLMQNRAVWNKDAAIGKTVVSSGMIDRVTKKYGRQLYEVPVGFKWFSKGLLDGSLCFGGEESAGASFSRLDGSVWTTDKDGIIPALLSAEITAKNDKDPGTIYKELTSEFGEPMYDRVEAKANAAEKLILQNISKEQIIETELAGEKIDSVITTAPGNNASLGGLKVSTANGWFALRPSGTEDIYKIYAESFKGKEHLMRLLNEAQKIADAVLNKK